MKTSNDSRGLLPCPYCGSKALSSDGRVCGSGIYVRCSNHDCLATGPDNDPDGAKWNAVAGGGQGADARSMTVCEFIEAAHYPKRIPVQITAGAEHSLFVLCSDGTIWECVHTGSPLWRQMPELPLIKPQENNTP